MQPEQKQSGTDKRAGGFRSSLKLVMIGVVSLGIFSGIYYLVVLGPMLDAGAAMRWGRYDMALSALGNIPARFTDTPGVPIYRSKAALGLKMGRDAPDWESVAEDLRALRAQRPSDADLMVLEARYLLRKGDYAKIGPLAEAATKEDGKNAEAWYLLGLHREYTGDLPKAVEHYRKAVELAANSLPYRNSLARGLLETGKPDEALAEFRKVQDFPLARVDEAMAHWAKGDMKQAAGLQREATGMLENAGISGQHYNRRDWMFRLPGNGDVRLSSSEDKLCYARLGESASRSLAGESAAVFPPAGCERAPKEVRELLAVQLCRYVDKPQPAMVQTASRLRRSLGANERCPA